MMNLEMRVGRVLLESASGAKKLISVLDRMCMKRQSKLDTFVRITDLGKAKLFKGRIEGVPQYGDLSSSPCKVAAEVTVLLLGNRKGAGWNAGPWKQAGAMLSLHAFT
eukprot:1144399-Pelagomonas_calceolata.AAC.1